MKVTVGSFGYSNDGQPGEGDNVQGSVENVVGGLGSDSLTGNGGPNVLRGGAGNDAFDGGLPTSSSVGPVSTS